MKWETEKRHGPSREDYALAAMTALITTRDYRNVKEESIAKKAFKLADAMIAESVANLGKNKT